MGTEGVKSLYTQMAHVQQAVGLTEEDMNQLGEGISYSTRMLYQMGKNSATIQTFNKGVVNLASAFTKVGLTVQDVNKLVEDLLDPSRIEDNALLYSKLGVSIQDVVSGNVDLSNMTDKMRDFGRQMKDMSGPAAAALAKQMGMTVMQARALADLPMDKGIGKAGKSLKGMYDDIRSPQEKIMILWHRIGTFLEEALSKAMPFIEKAINWIVNPANFKTALLVVGLGLIALVMFFRRRLLAVASDFGKTIETATTEGLAMANRKAQIIAANRPQDRGRAAGMMARVQAGPGYAEKKAAGAEFGVMAQGNVFASTAKMLQNTERWYSTLANGARPISAIGIIIDEQNRKLQDSIGFVRQQSTEYKEYFITQQKALEDRRKILDNERKLVDAMKEGGEKTYQLAKWTDSINKLDIQQGKIRDKIAAVDKQEDARILRRLRKESPEFLANQRRQLEMSLQGLKAENTKMQTELADYNLQKKTLELQFSRLEAQRKEMQQNGVTGEQYMKILSLIKETKKEDITVANLITDTNEKLKTQALDITGVSHAFARVKLATAEAGKGGAGSTALMSGIHRLGQVFIGGINNIGMKITNFGEKMVNSVKGTIQALGARLNPVNVIRSMVGKMREEGTGMGAFGKVLGKVGGFLLKIIIALGLLEPVQRIIGALLHAFKPIIDSLVKILFPALVKILKGIMPLVQILIQFLLPPLLKVLAIAVIIIGYLIKAIQFLVKIFDRKGDLSKAIGGVSDAMISAGTDILNSNDHLNTTMGSLSDNVEEANNREKAPGIISTSRGGHTTIQSRPGMGTMQKANADSGASTAENTNKLVDTADAHLQAQMETNKKLDTLIGLMAGRVGGAPAPITRQGQQNAAALAGGAH
jgi:hypothetical protein